MLDVVVMGDAVLLLFEHLVFTVNVLSLQALRAVLAVSNMLCGAAVDMIIDYN